MSLEEQKPLISSPPKSSMEILSELFGSFDAEPPVIVKKEKSSEQKKHKKKKKHKHKDKKHKKKSKKRKRDHSNSSENSGVDLTDILIKQEKEPLEKIPKTEVVHETLDIIIEDDNVENKKASEQTASRNKTDKSDDKLHKKDKIVIKDLKFSSIFDATILAIKEQERIKKNEEVTELVNEKHGTKRKRKHHHSKHSDNVKKRKRKSRSSSHEHKKKSKSKSRSRSPEKTDRTEQHKNERHRHKDDKHDHKSKYDDSRKHKESDYRTRHRDTFKHKDDYDDRRRKTKDTFYKNDSDSDKEEKWFMRDRYRGYNERDRDRDKRFRDKSEDNSNRIDKKKLLEIARKNAIQMMKSGNLPGALTLGPQAQEKVIAAIKSGGKTVEELTDFCKTLSKKEELGELSSISEDNGSESDNEKPFHHPFQLKERPLSITMNIKNSVPLPIKNLQERASELRIQFPVSSGQQHRKTENEWIPVSPKKTEPVPVPPPKQPPTNPVVPLVPVIPLAEIALPEPAPLPPVIDPTIVSQQAVAQVFPAPLPNEQNIDIAAIVTQRLSAMRKLQENPHDVQALNSMYKAQKEMNTWAESKQQIGQFTGSTGAQILSQAELSSGYQAWARKASALSEGRTVKMRGVWWYIHDSGCTGINFRLLPPCLVAWACTCCKRWVGNPAKVLVRRKQERWSRYFWK